MSRAAIFIDGAYRDFTMKNDFGGVRVDHSKFSVELLPLGFDALKLAADERFQLDQAFVDKIKR